MVHRANWWTGLDDDNQLGYLLPLTLQSYMKLLNGLLDSVMEMVMAEDQEQASMHGIFIRVMQTPLMSEKMLLFM